MSSNVLGPRDANAQMKATSPEKQADKPVSKSLDDHRQDLKAKLKEGDKTQQYISPSDFIQSPATEKLNAMRNKHIHKKAKPKTLFATTSSKKIDSSKGKMTFEDVPKKQANPESGDIPPNDITPQPVDTHMEEDTVFAPNLHTSPSFDDAIPVVEARAREQQAVSDRSAEEGNEAERDPELGGEQGDQQNKA
ncbi:hypothetical protein BU23DRAFT_516950 [Bimuria novae-zelandiae CBS 107.79]|uniref:Uncharacterized protein n=1 Tax=Bimuria novae-zelandiae CBS 107.79 TaxID=1447943 RepID=A0A6A5UPZ8_9PLEO|nr:hypothetical protein BU23DRAFT_516950 [Bimuria novae-zelandiae CBS 107.79]